jgi:TPR repeat protein
LRKKLNFVFYYRPMRLSLKFTPQANGLDAVNFTRNLLRAITLVLFLSTSFVFLKNDAQAQVLSGSGAGAAAGDRAFSEQLQSGLNALERKHYATALRSWRDLANQGDARAMNNVGLMYERGLGVTQSYVEAMSFYRKAADAGLPEAQYNLGTLYHNGYGVEVNNSQAVFWFRKAAAQRLPDAHYMMGLHLWEGKGVRRDPLAALAEFLKGARAGNVNSQFMAGYLFLSEEPTGKPNAVAGYTWVEVSRLNGYEGAIDITSFLDYRLKESEVELAKAMARRCLSTQYGDCPKL